MSSSLFPFLHRRPLSSISQRPIHPLQRPSEATHISSFVTLPTLEKDFTLENNPHYISSVGANPLQISRFQQVESQRKTYRWRPYPFPNPLLLLCSLARLPSSRNPASLPQATKRLQMEEFLVLNGVLIDLPAYGKFACPTRTTKLTPTPYLVQPIKSRYPDNLVDHPASCSIRTEILSPYCGFPILRLGHTPPRCLCTPIV